MSFTSKSSLDVHLVSVVRAVFSVHRLHVLTTFGSLLLFVMTTFSMPFLGSAPPDPMYFLNVMPFEYWLGLTLTVTALLIGIILHERGSRTSLTIISLFLLTGYVYLLPKLLFSNPIWTDTYIFVGETLHMLRYGYAGYGHALETPGLSLFAAQLSLVLGIDHLIIAQVLALLFPFCTVAIIYLFARLFRGGGTPYLAVMAYLGFMWVGFYFNRLSFALPLQFLAWYLVAKRFLVQGVKWSALALLTFFVVVFSHPASSFSVALSMVALVAFMFLRVGLSRTSNQSPLLKRSVISAVVITAVTLLTVWLSWNIYHLGSFYSAIRQTFIALDELFSAPDPLMRVAAIYGRGYADAYLPVVRLRLFIVVFNAVVGTVLSVLACIATKFSRRFTILAAIFFTAAAFTAYTTYAYRWADKGFIYTVFPVAILVSWFVLGFKAKRALTVKAVKAFKLVIATVVIFSIALVPLLMYSHMAFVYPPSMDLAMLEFLAGHGQGSTYVIGGHAEVDYVVFAEETFLNWEHKSVPELEMLQTDALVGYNLIATTFRAYTKDAFVIFDPPLRSAMADFTAGLIDEHRYSEIYQADEWHKIYSQG